MAQSLSSHSLTPPALALRPREAAQALGISLRHLFRLTKCGEIPSVRVGTGKRKTVLYPIGMLEGWLEQRVAFRGEGDVE